MDEQMRLLVVDDEAEICSLLHDVLMAEGYSVEVCTDSRHALDRIRDRRLRRGDHRPQDARRRRPHCRPDRQGLLPETATIVVTAYASVQTAIGALRTGVDDYICKPFDIDHIVDVVRRAISIRLAEKKNRLLLGQLRASNSRLQQHEKKLADRVINTSRNLMSSNARLTRRVGELSMLNDMSDVLANELNLDQLLNLALKIVKEKMGVRARMIVLADPRRTARRQRVPRLRRLDRRKLSRRERGSPAPSPRSKQPLLIEDIYREEGVRPADFEINGFASVLGVPLMTKEKLIGVLLVYDKASHDKFTREDTHLLTTIASQMGIAIENARLYAVLQESTLQTVQALASSLEAKDNYTSGHSARVSHYSMRIAAKLGLSEKETAQPALRIPAPRHRQDRHHRAHPQQARAALRLGGLRHPRPSRNRRAHHPVARLPRGRPRRHPPPPRALGRRRLPRRPRRRRRAAPRAHNVHRRRVRRDDHRAPLPRRARAPDRRRRAPRLRRQPVRSQPRRGLPPTAPRRGPACRRSARR